MDSAVAEVIAALPVHVPAGGNLPAVAAPTPAAKIEAYHEEQQRKGVELTPAQMVAYKDQEQLRAAAKALLPYVDAKTGMVESLLLQTAGLSYGYSLAALPTGTKVNAIQFTRMMQNCRHAGFSQQIIDAYIKAEIELGA